MTELLTGIFISDLHGNLPDPKELSGADYLFFGGDIPPLGATTIDPMYDQQYAWYQDIFGPYLESLDYPPDKIIAALGNHDFIATLPWGMRMLKALPWTLLHDQHVTLENGQTVFGSAWSPRHMIYPNWAFQAEDHMLKRHWEKIPMHTDILLVHTPVYGHVDIAGEAGHVGSITLAEFIHNRRWDIHTVLSGHIHEAHGQVYDKRLYLNASRCLMNAKAQNNAFKFVLGPEATKAKPVVLTKEKKQVWLGDMNMKKWDELASLERIG